MRPRSNASLLVLVELMVAERQQLRADVERAATRDVVLGDVAGSGLTCVDQDEVDRRRELVADAGPYGVAEAVVAGVSLEQRIARVRVDHRARRRRRLSRRVVEADDAVDQLLEVEVVSASPVDLEALPLVVRVAAKLEAVRD